MKQTDRWVSMAAVLLAGVLLTFDIGCQTHEDAATSDPSSASCTPDAKPAALDITLKDMNGADVHLASFKGKVLLINFWATWCGPCKAEIPDLVALQKQYGQDLQVLGISVDDDAKDMQPYAESFQMNYPVLVGKEREDVEKAYGPFLGIPQSFVVGRDGKICYKHAGIASKAKFEQEIKSLL
jgi:thiol-disulfide isomerase/thioredoxin